LNLADFLIFERHHFHMKLIHRFADLLIGHTLLQVISHSDFAFVQEKIGLDLDVEISEQALEVVVDVAETFKNEERVADHLFRIY
jgi:hypothetical protein